MKLAALGTVAFLAVGGAALWAGTEGDSGTTHAADSVSTESYQRGPGPDGDTMQLDPLTARRALYERALQRESDAGLTVDNDAPQSDRDIQREVHEQQWRRDRDSASQSACDRYAAEVARKPETPPSDPGGAPGDPFEAGGPANAERSHEWCKFYGGPPDYHPPRD